MAAGRATFVVATNRVDVVNLVVDLVDVAIDIDLVDFDLDVDLVDVDLVDVDLDVDLVDVDLEFDHLLAVPAVFLFFGPN